ncbi:hypothetical protein C9374_003962 [Naegleria lovaniensis]|uniref:Transmembrane protein n=1 Tax=Naegleria lovaniensis TaxID=51637 RepID=A0AA88H477_NAELO|nr:uncharacterized protein C9374_003962 [Naegleria lovaniensis]KAG2394198.1 hypothetical protein C9374_003962 [Naegleria lovaniensis]
MLNPNDSEDVRPLSSSIFSPSKMSMRKPKAKISTLLRPGTAPSSFYHQILHQPGAENGDAMRNRGTFLAPQDENLIEINSDLPLAMLIYFHTFYSMTWLIVTVVLHIFKQKNYSITSTNTIIFSVVIVVWTVIEFPRLLIGYSGNLKEKVPRVFAFMILSTIQPLLYIYFFIYQPKVIPLDYIICAIQVIFYALEYIFGIIAMRNFTRVSGIRYKLYFNKDGTLAMDDSGEEDEENNKNHVEPFTTTTGDELTTFASDNNTIIEHDS